MAEPLGVRFAVEDEINAGDKEIIRWSDTGTNNAGISIARVSGGKIAEEWVSLDTLRRAKVIGEAFT